MLGTLRATLEETGLERNTLLVFSSDHGDLLGAHGGRNKQQPYDECIRVPLLLYWPAGLGSVPRSLDALINTEDIMPTILGLCGVPIPRTVEGLDYSGYARGAPSPSDGAALISCVAPFGQWTSKLGGREYRGIRTLRYTYVRDQNGPWLLFDNQVDPASSTIWWADLDLRSSKQNWTPYSRASWPSSTTAFCRRGSTSSSGAIKWMKTARCLMSLDSLASGPSKRD